MPSVENSRAIMHQRNIIQAKAMERMINTNTDEEQRLTEELDWSIQYAAKFNTLFEDTARNFRADVLAGNIEAVIQQLKDSTN